MLNLGNSNMEDFFQGCRQINIPTSVIDGMRKNIFLSNLYVTQIGYYPKALHHFNEKENGSPDYILIYCHKGKGWYQLNDTKYSVQENQFFFVPKHTPHSYGADEKDPWTVYWIHFSGNFANLYVKNHSTVTTIYQSANNNTRESILVFEEIYHTLTCGFNEDNLHHSCSTLYYFLNSFNYCNKHHLTYRKNESVLKESIRFMQANLEKNISVKDMSENVNLSESYFFSLFKKQIGYTPLNYLINLRMKVACDMLYYTNLKVNQICPKVGINDPLYFSKLFTKVLGFSPTEYRKKFQKKL